MELKVGDLVRTADWKVGTVAVINGDAVYVNIKVDQGSYLKLAKTIELTKIDGSPEHGLPSLPATTR